MELAKPLYDYMRAREQIRLKKESGEKWPWTDDPFLTAYKFTNVRRSDDWTTKQLVEHFYKPMAGRDYTPADLILNCGIFRYFGTFEFALAHGAVRCGSWDHGATVKLAHERQAAGETVFTGAYIVTNAGFKGDKVEMLVNNFLANLEKLAPMIAAAALKTGKWETLVTRIRDVPGFGGMGFMAKEAALDVALTDFWEHSEAATTNANGKKIPTDWNTYTPVGPGARRGLNVLLGRPIKQHLAESYALQLCRKLYEVRGKYWNQPGDIELELSDIQFSLCELAKYRQASEGKKQKRLYLPRDPVAAGVPVRTPRSAGGSGSVRVAANPHRDADLESLLNNDEVF